MNKLIVPVLDYVHDGLRHRKWVFPARVYTGRDWGVTQEKWIYAVGEAPYAVTFSVGTGRYPSGYDTDTRPPSGWDESWHRTQEGGHGCIFLDGVACHSDGSMIDAEEWYASAPGKNAEGFVPDDTVFAHVRERYAAWAQPAEGQE